MGNGKAWSSLRREERSAVIEIAAAVVPGLIWFAAVGKHLSIGNEDCQTQFQEILIVSPRTGARDSQTGPALLLRRHSPRAVAIRFSAVGCQLINFAWD